jgi:hypothetical protein
MALRDSWSLRYRLAMMLFAVAVNPLLCALGAVQILGIVAAASARMAEGTRYERWGQWVCLLSLVVMGGLCCWSLQLGPGVSAACAVTLTLMTLIAIMDFE